MLKKSSLSEFIHVMLLAQKRLFIYAIAQFGACIAFASFQITIAFTNKNMINAAVEGNRYLLHKAVVIAGISLIIACFIHPVMSYIYNRTVKYILTTIKINMFSHAERLPMSFYDNCHSGDLISRLNNDVNAVESIYGIQTHMLLASVLYGFGAALSMFLLDWRLASITMVFGIVSVRINMLFTNPLRLISDKLQKQMSYLAQSFVDITASVRLYKIFNIKDILTEKFRSRNNEVSDIQLKQIRIRSQMDSVNFMLSTASFLIIFSIGAIMVLHNLMDFGTVVAIASLQNGVSYMFQNFGNFIPQIQGSLAGAARISELMNQGKEPERYVSNSPSYSSTEAIAMNNVVFGYDGREKVLNGISISLPKGGKAALVGASGEGKSTILKLLLAFYFPQSGDIILNGKSISSYTFDEIRLSIAYVDQDSYLFAGTIEENVKYGKSDATHEEVISACRSAHIHDVIMNMPDGYNTRLGEGGNRLSGGQRQRIAIARAFLKNAPILLLDEPTSSLDSENEYQVQRALDELMKGRTVLIVAHRLTTIKNVDMIYVIENGKVAEQGSHEELFLNGTIYKHLYELQH